MSMNLTEIKKWLEEIKDLFPLETLAYEYQVIDALFKEMEDIKSVVAKKCREWIAEEKMNIYLRPATLFNKTKFANYKGELHKAQK